MTNKKPSKKRIQVIDAREKEQKYVVYFPVEYPKDSNGQSVMIPPGGYVSGPTRRGKYKKMWAYRKVFDNYGDYIKYLKSDEYLGK